MKIIKRSGEEQNFDREKIVTAISLMEAVVYRSSSSALWIFSRSRYSYRGS